MWETKKRRKWEITKRRKWEIKKEEREKLRNENEQLKKNNAVNDATIKELIKIKSLEEDKNVKNFPNWFDKNKFKNISNSNTFSYKHKIGEFKYIDIKDLINKIENNTISEISAKKDLNDLNTLNEIKNVGITKEKRLAPK